MLNSMVAPPGPFLTGLSSSLTLWQFVWPLASFMIISLIFVAVIFAPVYLHLVIYSIKLHCHFCDVRPASSYLLGFLPPDCVF